ncbi:MAG TPA: uroporphyrinogen decarboxylase family protein [Spirochaetia bacterium]|nr:uroporphyrinogen decarboxylase family protein [Spirochaetia bacterium]
MTLTTTETPAERRKTWRSPAGAISEHWQFLPEARCWAHDEYAVKKAADLPVLLDIFERMRFKACPGIYARLDEWIGSAGLPLAPAPRSPLPALLADWCGVENTVFLLADHPGLVVEVLSAIDRANDGAFAAVLASPCDLVHFCDNLDSSASTSYFDALMRDYYEKRVAQLHRAGKHAVVHLDGRVRGLLPRLAACGFDGVESITPLPVGDVSIEELRGLAGNQSTILWGGIPGAMFCSPWELDDVRRHMRRLLDCLAVGGRLIVGSADQIPPNGNLDYCRMIADVIDEWAG